MDIPRGHAAMPLSEADFLDFIYNYFKAEYAPIRSFWSTATADPKTPSRWYNMGHELAPLHVRPANAQAQKDIESIDFFTRKWNLDAGFVRGLIIRFAKYEIHDRLEKKLYECARLDLMVRKALKEKHLIDALWPSPAPRNLPQELLQQGVQVRRWYGDMFNKYFRVLHSIEQFELRPEVDARIKSTHTLMLVPHVDHLIFGTVDPIMPIVARGAGYSNAKGWQQKGERVKSDGFGEPARFEVRFDAPADVQDTYTKTVTRQCQCNKCGTQRDVQVVISVDPNPTGGPKTASTSGSRRSGVRVAQKYAPGYNMPGENDQAPPKPPRPQQTRHEEVPRASTPEQKKQCYRCTFLNHAELTVCEMCQAELPAVTVTKPPSPVAVKSSRSHSASLPFLKNADAAKAQEDRPPGLNRHSLSSTLFSIFPFSQQHQQEHQANLSPTQGLKTPPIAQQNSEPAVRQERASIPQDSAQPAEPSPSQSARRSSVQPMKTSIPPHAAASESETPLSRAPEMTMMPLTPPPTVSAGKRPAPVGLPSNLMDDFVPVSPRFSQEENDEDAGWGEMSKEEAKGEHSSDEEEYQGRLSGGMVDLDAVAREEADVWGERED